MSAVVAEDACSDYLALGLVLVEAHFRELLAAAHARVFHQNAMGVPDLRIEMLPDGELKLTVGGVVSSTISPALMSILRELFLLTSTLTSTMR